MLDVGKAPIRSTLRQYAMDFLIHVETVPHVSQVVLAYYDIEYPCRYVSNPQRMLETGMSRTRVDHERSCKLMDMAESLDNG